MDVKISYKKDYPKGYCAQFKIENQTFTLTNVDTKSEAIFYTQMLKIAFETLAKPDGFDNFKSDVGKEDAISMANPKINVTIK